MPGFLRIKAKEIANDILSGMAPGELMEKYHISVKGLNSALRKLLEISLLSKAQVDAWASLNRPITIVTGIRACERSIIDIPLSVQDRDFPYQRGLLKDMSEKGLGIYGIKARVGEPRSFVVRCFTGTSDLTIALETRCRWTSPEKVDDGPSCAGFEITDISEADTQRLKLLLEQVKSKVRT
jgi:hypothetical protein